jgi:hypothetical protein
MDLWSWEYRTPTVRDVSRQPGTRVRKASTLPRQRLRRSGVGLLGGLHDFARQLSSPRAKWIARSIALSRAELRTTRRSRSKLFGTSY